MLKKLGIAGCLITAALAVMPAGAMAQERPDYRRFEGREFQHVDYREYRRDWRAHERREWLRNHYHRGYYDRFGHWCWY